MANKGGKRTGAGRPVGSKQKVTPEIKAMAMKHCPAALETIVHLAQNGENESTRLAAAREILDRGYGKPRQSIAAEVSHIPPRELIMWGRCVGGLNDTDSLVSPKVK
jgi:hypothetical protein